MSRLIVDMLEGKYPVQQHRSLCESATSALQLLRGTDNFSTSEDGFRLPYVSEPCKPHSFVSFGLTHYMIAVQFGKPVSIQVAFQKSTARPALSVSKVTHGNDAHEQFAALTGAIPLDESPAGEQCQNLHICRYCGNRRSSHPQELWDSRSAGDPELPAKLVVFLPLSLRLYSGTGELQDDGSLGLGTRVATDLFHYVV